MALDSHADRYDLCQPRRHHVLTEERHEQLIAIKLLDIGNSKGGSSTVKGMSPYFIAIHMDSLKSKWKLS